MGTQPGAGGNWGWGWAASGVAVFVVAVAVSIYALSNSGGAGDAVSVTPPTIISTTTTTTTTTSTTTTTTLPPTTTTRPVPVDVGTGPAAPVFSRIPTTDPVVFLTIDDGIVQDPAVVDYLSQQHIPVTIFPVPAYVQRNEAYFQSIHALGASVQDHTVHHPDLAKLSAANQRNEICGPLDEYQAKFGARPWMFRPPYGSMNPSVPEIARGCGIRAVVLWRAATNDGRLDVQGGALHAGDIILMHFRTDLRQNLEVALNAIRAAGLRPARLEDYLIPG